MGESIDTEEATLATAWNKVMLSHVAWSAGRIVKAFALRPIHCDSFDYQSMSQVHLIFEATVTGAQILVPRMILEESDDLDDGVIGMNDAIEYPVKDPQVESCAFQGYRPIGCIPVLVVDTIVEPGVIGCNGRALDIFLFLLTGGPTKDRVVSSGLFH